MQYDAFGREVGQPLVMSREDVDQGSRRISALVLVKYGAS